MAKKYDEQEHNNLKSQKQSNEGEQAACQAEIDTINEWISRLRGAYNGIDDAKESIDDIKRIHSNMPTFYECFWKGSKAQHIYDMCESGELKTSYQGYVDNIDAVEDDINWKINELKESQNERYGILSGLVNAWEDLCTRIRNFFN